ncbi:MAG: indole-3-glycerol phosphate synthase TrpC [Gemmatimonadota bacterium]
MDGSNLAEQNPKVKSGPGYLARTVARKRLEVAECARRTSEGRLRDLAGQVRRPRPWAKALRGDGVAVIAEIKRRSPSAGSLDPDVDPATRAEVYARHGAVAVSVLTDGDFGGELNDLERVALAIELPVLRKDFLVDPWQVWESRAAGADAALVIVAALGERELAAVASAAREAGVGLLVEIHDLEEIPRALALDPEAVGVNARDLRTLETDADWADRTLAALRREAAAEIVVVAESGIASPADVRRARESGADAVLVGEALMRAEDPGRRLAELVAAGGAW